MKMHLGRWWAGVQHRREEYTPVEVLERLRHAEQVDSTPRTRAVHAAAAEVGSWTALLGPTTAFELGRAADRLPSAVFWFVQGRSLEEIGRSLQPLGGPWDAERALYVAGCLIAALLNRRAAGELARSARNTRSI